MLLADGAMGTELLRRSPGLDRPSSLNLLNPELVLALHREYVQAGARLLMTNTLGATPEEAAAGVRLAREASTFVAGSLTADPLPSPALIQALDEADILILETV